jgi:hypothetical protein
MCLDRRAPNQRFHYVITLCDRVREVCPKFLSDREHPRRGHAPVSLRSVERASKATARRYALMALVVSRLLAS